MDKPQRQPHNNWFLLNEMIEQAELAKLQDIDRTILTKYETGVSERDLERLYLIGEILEVDYNTILKVLKLKCPSFCSVLRLILRCDYHLVRYPFH